MSDYGIPRNDLPRVARAAADLLLRYDWKVWFWGDSIGMEGLLDAAHLLGERAYASFVHGVLKAWSARLDPQRRWEYTAAGVALLRVCAATHDHALLEAAVRHAAYLAGFRRTEHGAYIRYEDAQFNLPPELPAGGGAKAPGLPVGDGGPCVFVDSMHFDGPFFCRLYGMTGDARYRQLGIENIVASIELLFDRKRHLFNHFWSEKQRTVNGVFWGRGQGWALLGMVGVLESLPVDDPAFAGLRDVLRQQCAALASLQDTSGHWHTVVDDADSYLESSVAAFVVDGFSRALRNGWLGDEYRPVVDRAMAALLAQVAADGRLDGVSYETYPSFAAEHYRLMPCGAMVPWGQGPLLAAIRSYSELPAVSP